MIGLTAMRFAIHIIVSQHKKIERYKGVIKLLEKDVAEAKKDAAKEFAKFLIDRSEGGVISVADLPELVIVWERKVESDD